MPSFDRLIEYKMPSEKYEVQNDGLYSFCISYFALFTLHFRCSFAALWLSKSFFEFIVPMAKTFFECLANFPLVHEQAHHPAGR